MEVKILVFPLCQFPSHVFIYGFHGGIILEVPGIQGLFEGRYLDQQQTELKGKWKQSIVTLDLTLTRSDGVAEQLIPPPPEEPARPQTPMPPYPCRVVEVEIPTSEQDVTLAGTFVVPEKKPNAGVLLVSASGPQNRDETIFDHKPFHIIADHFARHGIASLRYDDRGVAKSTGDFSSATSYDFADDAESVFNFLAGSQELAGRPIGICGHSEGGLLAPLIAARNQRVDFLILMAAPGVNGREIILSQGPLIMRAQGVPEDVISMQQKTQQVILSIMRDYEHPAPELVAAQLRTAHSDTNADLPKLIAESQKAMEQQATPWLRTFLKLDPKTALKAIKCPVLVINGTKDLQVDPVLNLTAIRDTLQKSGHQRFEINVYPNLNHLFQSCQSGLPSEYGKIEETFNPVPLQRMTSWILEQAERHKPARTLPPDLSAD